MKLQLSQIALLSTSLLAINASAAEQIVLNVASAGSQNMVDYVKTYLAPKFEAAHPGVSVRVFGTGPGDAGSHKIMEKLEAQQKNNAQTWDIDVAVVHQKIGGEMKNKDLLSQYRSEVNTSNLVSRDSATNALGVNVDGYVMPMFHSQTAIAYNSDLVKQVPQSYDELVQWAQDHPKAFGYNGIKNGMSGVSFVTGWIYAYGSDAEQLSQLPYKPELKNSWTDAFAQLKSFNNNVTFTPGNAGTLDMLNRGEIVMGPVWVDMFYSWKDSGKIPPSMKLALIAPGMPGQPMYYVVPDKASQADLAKAFIELATSPEVQAEGIVERFNWYPGIDAQHVKSQMEDASWNKLFAEISPSDLSRKGKNFPIAAYFDDIKESYERQVAN
ncbi:extracellular solute-binding protein [Alginatibacterium sediminis]|uniref:Extracellular solute-binding protein n=1 Tax=Alginatibacterium sediminis TaxID=2164068 RepID=A0A420EDB6_9ALTE|nr:extracellular solute-binding protein [Alginatibacterium sediminis]RKF18665.1 extracellular solute-binding protein [Alginatibacterium sediminis]